MKNKTEFAEAVSTLRDDIANFLDKKLGMSKDDPPNSERDRMVVAALLDFAAQIAVQDGSEMGAVAMFTNTIVALYRAEREQTTPEDHKGHGCERDPLRKH